MNTAAPKVKTRILYEFCPLCNGKDIPVLLSADCTKHPLYNPALDTTITWKQCKACSHIFTDGYFTDEAARIVFSKTHENQQVGNDMERQRYVSAHMVEKVLPYHQNGYWLDIGFGNASLLFTAHEYGFKPVGVDLREKNVATLKQFGIEAHAVDVAKLPHDDRYSVISLADVLEHVPYPKMFLATVSRLLKAGGVALISMPNADCMLWHAMNKMNANPYWMELEHFHNFGRARLYALLRECGFEPVRYGVSERYRVCMEVVARKTD